MREPPISVTKCVTDSEVTMEQIDDQGLACIKRMHKELVHVPVDLNLNQTESRLERLKVHFAGFEAQHCMRLQGHLAMKPEDGQGVKKWGETTEELHSHYMNVEDMFLEVENALVTRRKQLSAVTIKPEAGVTTMPPSCGSNDMRLPALKITQFDGSEENWLEFRDMFEAVVHNRPNIDSAIKLARLREAVDCTKVTQASGVYTGGYDAVWAEIKRRYDRPKRLVLAHMNRIMSMEDNPAESRLRVRQVIDQFRNFVRAMDVLKQPTKEWDAMLFPMIFRKLPEEAVAYYNRAVRDDNIPSVHDILSVVEDYAETVSSVEENVTSPSVHHQSRAKQGQRTYLVQVPVVPVNPRGCDCCGVAHKLVHCDEFKALSGEQRQEFARQKRLCFNCLEGGHSYLTCAGDRCNKCGQQHHQLLCRKVQGGGVQPQNLPRA